MMKNRAKNVMLIFSFFIASSIFQNCSNIENKNMMNDSTLQKQNASFPRGIIEITIVPVEIIENEKLIFCKATIDKVHKTGGGIRPVAEKTDYSFEVNQTHKEHLKKNIGTPIRCQIAEIMGGMYPTNASKYKIIRIIK